MAEADPLLGLDAAADRLGLSRLFVQQQALAAALLTTVGVDGVPMVPLSVLLAWHSAMRNRQQVAMAELGAEIDRELLGTDASTLPAGNKP